MAWSSKTQITSAVTVNSTTKQDASSSLTLNPGESVHFQVEADYPVSPTSELVVYLQSTLDDSSEDWDDGVIIMVISNDTDPNYGSYTTGGSPSIYKARLIYALDTGTDSVTVNAFYRTDGVSL